MKKTVLSYIKSLIFTIVIYFIILIIVAGISLTKDLNDSFIYYLSFIPVVLASLAGGAACSVMQGKRGLLNGVLSQMFFFFILVLISVLNSGEIRLYILIPLAVCVAFGAAGGILGVNIKRR